MSEKSKKRRQAYKEKQAEQGARVFNWIIGILAVMAVALLIFYSFYA